MRDPDNLINWAISVGIVAFGILMLGSLTWLVVDSAIDSSAKRECAVSGGKVERVSEWRTDWYCNGGRAERAP